MSTTGKVLLLSAGAIAIYVAALLFWPTGRIASDAVLLLTVCVVIWYAVETAEIRKQGERRAEIEAMPVVGHQLSRREVPGQPSLWLEVTNYTRNPATLRVILRLRTTAGDGRFSQGPYSGHKDWNLHEHHRFRGWFPLAHLLAAVQDEGFKLAWQELLRQPPRITWPANPEMQLDVQVAVYDAARRLRRVLHQEYKLIWAGLETDYQFWPEIAPQALERLPWPPTLPDGNLPI